VISSDLSHFIDPGDEVELPDGPVAERLDLKLDTAKLREHVFQLRDNLVFFHQSENYGGWGVLSSDGELKSAWNPNFGGDVEGWMKPERFHFKPTVACYGYVAEVIQQIRGMGFFPRRARVAMQASNSRSATHQDWPSFKYALRLHIPIFTNTGCSFWTEKGEVHLPADGAGYLVRVNQLHQIRNDGPTNRYHLFMTVWDTKGVSEFNRWPLPRLSWMEEGT
jgi:hypothetical protein